MPAPAASDGTARRPRTIKGRAREVARRLALEYPEARCEQLRLCFNKKGGTTARDAQR